MVQFSCEKGMINIFYCQHVCIFNYEKHYQNKSGLDSEKVPNKSPPGLLIFKYLYDLKLIRTSVYSFLNFIYLTGDTSLIWTDLFKIFLHHCILRFFQLKSASQNQNAGDSSKTPFPPTRATKNRISWSISFFRQS